MEWLAAKLLQFACSSFFRFQLESLTVPAIPFCWCVCVCVFAFVPIVLHSIAIRSEVQVIAAGDPCFPVDHCITSTIAQQRIVTSRRNTPPQIVYFISYSSSSIHSTSKWCRLLTTLLLQRQTALTTNVVKLKIRVVGPSNLLRFRCLFPVRIQHCRHNIVARCPAYKVADLSICPFVYPSPWWFLPRRSGRFEILDSASVGNSFCH